MADHKQEKKSIYSTVKNWIFPAKEITESLLFDSFCDALKKNKIAEAQKLFKQLSSRTQDFIKITSNFILKKQLLFTPEKHDLSIRIMNIISDKKEDTPKEAIEDSKEDSQDIIEDVFQDILEGKDKPKTSEKKVKKDFDNLYQKYETPSEEDALYIFYTTLLEEKPNSKIAIVWLVEYGVETTKTQIDKYKKIKKKK